MKRQKELIPFIKENTWLDRKYINVGWGNGYVAIPKGHKYFGVDYNNVDVEIHGGLTFSSPSEEIKSWKELPKQCHDNFWIVGFDTAHSGDTIENRPKEWVKTETDELLKQLIK